MAAILILAGGGGAHSLFSVGLVRALAEAAYGETSYAHASDVHALRDAFEARRGGAFVAFLEAPSHDCALLLRRSRTRVAVFADGLEDSVGFFMEHHGAEFASALRYATRGHAAIAGLLDRGHAGLFREPASGTILAHHLRRLALFFGIEPSDALVSDVLSRLGFTQAGDGSIGTGPALIRHLPARARIAGRLASLPEHENAILQRIAPGYDGLHDEGGKEAPLVWPAEFCLLGDRPGEPFRERIDITGAARVLAYGPYLHLPAGEWEASVVLSTGGNLSGNIVSIRYAGAGPEREADDFALPSEGRLELRTRLTVETASEPMEMILRSMEGAIEGWVSIDSIELRKQPE